MFIGFINLQHRVILTLTSINYKGGHYNVLTDLNLDYQILILCYITVVLFSGVLGVNVVTCWHRIFVSQSYVYNCGF